MKGPWADNSLQALLNTYEGELLHLLSHRERQKVSILERMRQIEIVYNKTNEKKRGESIASGKWRHCTHAKSISMLQQPKYFSYKPHTKVQKPA